MADHTELIAEMALIEQMGSNERQKLAKKRRLQQIKKWTQREREWLLKEKQINKRLANAISKENNGLDLTSFSLNGSFQETKTQNTDFDSVVDVDYDYQNSITATATTTNNNNNTLSNNNNNNNNNIDKESERLLSSNIKRRGDTQTSQQAKFARNKPTARHKNEFNKLVEPIKTNAREKVHFESAIMLLEAAARNDIEEVRRLLTLGVSPNSINHDGLTALHQCCIDASEPMMNLLLEFGANVDARDMEHWTPLHAACTCGHLSLVKTLVEHNANLLAVNGDGNLPFDICEDEQTLDYVEAEMLKRNITQELIEETRNSIEQQMLDDIKRFVAFNKQQQDLNDIRLEPSGASLLHVAAANGYANATRFLLTQNIDVNACDNDMWTSLHGVACWGVAASHLQIVELLVEYGADLNAKTINDETVFDLCDNVELLNRLNELKDELESKNEANKLDRLRRSQSKSNNRFHSIRRKSIREKNQISRREAREEAQLRVDSQQTTNNDDELQLTTKQKLKQQQHQVTTTNFAQQQQNTATTTTIPSSNVVSVDEQLEAGCEFIENSNNCFNHQRLNNNDYCNGHEDDRNKNKNKENNNDASNHCNGIEEDVEREADNKSQNYACIDNNSNKNIHIDDNDYSSLRYLKASAERKACESGDHAKLNCNLQDNGVDVKVEACAKNQTQLHALASDQSGQVNDNCCQSSTAAAANDLQDARYKLQATTAIQTAAVENALTITGAEQTLLTSKLVASSQLNASKQLRQAANGLQAIKNNSLLTECKSSLKQQTNCERALLDENTTTTTATATTISKRYLANGNKLSSADTQAKGDAFSTATTNNLTLAHLKRQRSDLRNSRLSLTANSSLVSTQLNVALINNDDDGGGDDDDDERKQKNGIVAAVARCEDVRKFSGQLADTVDGGKFCTIERTTRKSVRKCCALL